MTSATSSEKENQNGIILGTAQVQFRTANKKVHIVRSLCDNGSQVNLISRESVKKLKIKPELSKTSFIGIGGNKLGSAMGKCTLQIQIPKSKNYIEAEFFVVKAITNYSPQEHNGEWKGIKDNLADAEYNKPGKINALLGLGLWIKIAESEILKSPSSNAMAQKTKLGYVIFKTNENPYETQHPYVGSVITQESTDELSKQIRKLWELEKLEIRKFSTTEEKQCEEIFQNYHRKDETGRYIVRIPFNEKLGELGKSKMIAIKQFFAMEAKMKRNKEFGEQYKKFMSEYLSLGHMEQIHEVQEEGYYTPHHAVFSAEKFRTVFNASARTSTGITLNDTQLVGEKLQRDLIFILMNFRRFKYGITADIEKMYRQVQIYKPDRKYQKIIWRFKESEPIGVYQLNTVTYGHASAPHNAIRTLIQCARDYMNLYPLGASTIQTCFYVDDLITGADTPSKIMEIKNEVKELLKKGCFNITKWRSNLKANQEVEVPLIDKDPEIKSVLGLYWNTKTDKFTFKFKSDEDEDQQVWTKRKILSKIGKLYDPNGFIGPIIFRGKLIIQSLWRDKMDWDEKLTPELKQEWEKFNSELKLINRISIDRWLGTLEVSQIQLHGFCDASEKGYGAAIYSRVKDETGRYRTTLIASKSRVAPLKITTIPRLELCAANLLAELTKTVQPLFKDCTTSIYSWSDSRIILCWLNKSPANLKAFVANRIANIQEIAEELQQTWKWTSGKDNPADLLSRGVVTEELIENTLWWKGPEWLQESEDKWPKIQTELKLEDNEVTKEMKIINFIHHIEPAQLTRGKWFQHPRATQQAVPLLQLYEDWNKLKRVTATIFRARENFKNPLTKKERRVGSLSMTELRNAETFLIRQDQKMTYRKEIQLLKKSIKGTIGNLAVFWDKTSQIIRIDGRIKGSFLSFNEQFPILLSKDGALAKMLIRHAHYNLLHAGNQLIQQYLRKQYWITHARAQIKNFTRKCPTCFRQRMKTSEQIMSSLPEYRTTPKRAFSNVGVDYAGPFMLRPNLLRGRANQTRLKAYIAVFVCLVTRAIHLELVSDSSTQAFIAALRRMVSRRGAITMIISDNATNFVGARNFLQTINKLNNDNASTIEQKFELTWKFTTPAAPHHGGIYEAAVKSTKYHLKRVIGEQSLTFEEFSTILCQIEACLNSRPLAALSDDPTNLTVITPGHFLIGEELIGIQDNREIPEKTYWHNRWEHLQFMVQHFWKRWKTDYLMQLVNRVKWNKQSRNLEVNDLVVLSEDNVKAGEWKIGRIIKTFPGSDNRVRSAIVRIGMGYDKRNNIITAEYKRPITKLGLLLPREEQL